MPQSKSLYNNIIYISMKNTHKINAMNELRKMGITCRESEVYDNQGNDLRDEDLLFWIDNESNVETEYHLEGGVMGNPTEAFEKVCDDLNLFVEPYNSAIYLVYLDA